MVCNDVHANKGLTAIWGVSVANKGLSGRSQIVARAWFARAEAPLRVAVRGFSCPSRASSNVFSARGFSRPPQIFSLRALRLCVDSLFLCFSRLPKTCTIMHFPPKSPKKPAI